MKKFQRMHMLSKIRRNIHINKMANFWVYTEKNIKENFAFIPKVVFKLLLMFSKNHPWQHRTVFKMVEILLNLYVTIMNRFDIIHSGENKFFFLNFNTSRFAPSKIVSYISRLYTLPLFYLIVSQNKNVFTNGFIRS